MRVVKAFAFRVIPEINAQNQVIGITERPYLPLKIKYPRSHQTSQYNISCLVDSGSDVNLFPADMATSVGINFSKGEPRRIIGIGGIEIPSFLCSDIQIILPWGLKFSTEIQFSERQSVPLLGRKGFFDYFEEVIFNVKNSSFKLVYEK